MPASSAFRWLRLIPLHDLVWLLLFGALAATTERGDPWVIAMLASLAIAQVLETKLAVLSSESGRIYWNLLKLVLGVVLIAYTGSHSYTESGIPIGGIESRYWMVLALPMISAATALGVGGTLVFSLLAAGSYLMFLLPPFFDWKRLQLDPAALRMWCCGRPFWQWWATWPTFWPRTCASRTRNSAAPPKHLAEANAAHPGGRGGGAALRPPGRAGAAFGGPGARAAQSAGHHQGVRGNAGPHRRRPKTK